MAKTPNHIHEADYSLRTPLYTVIGKNLVLRRPLTPQELQEPSKMRAEMTVTEHDKRFAELLADLQEKYGIKSPKMSSYIDGPTVFIEGQWVEGKNLSDEAADIPVLVIRHALQSIINYYLEATRNGGDYLTDLRPSNIMYGRIDGDTEDHLYFIDLEPRWASNKPGNPLPVRGEFELAEPELMFLLHEGKTRDENWVDLKERFEELKSLQELPAV
ncbi:MAG TPA: hypothetical protein VFJ84_02140 [Candidatus Saccharimonadales bacterium]|nr:hypothetical protein [Candidatus Saccharimonadales bacterium]